jgi:hypothetical protein
MGHGCRDRLRQRRRLKSPAQLSQSWAYSCDVFVVGDKSRYHSLRQPRSIGKPPHRSKFDREAEAISSSARGLRLPELG